MADDHKHEFIVFCESTLEHGGVVVAQCKHCPDVFLDCVEIERRVNATFVSYIEPRGV